MTAEGLDQIEERVQAATPGPWRWTGQPPNSETGFKGGLNMLCVARDAREHEGFDYKKDALLILTKRARRLVRPEDAAFISHAREDVQRLCGALRESTGTQGREGQEHGHRRDEG